MASRRRSSRRSFGFPRIAQFIALGAIALIVGILVVVALRPPTPTAASNEPRPVFTPTPTAEPVQQRIAFLGDSWTAGSGSDSAATAYAPLTAQALGFNWDQFGAGGTGYTATNPTTGEAPFINRVQAVIDSQPDVVVVQGSSNDYAATEDEIKAAALEVFTALRAGLPDAQIFALGMMHSPNSPPEADAVSLAGVAAAASETGVTFIDGNNPAWLVIPDDFLDGYHPNQVGHTKVAEGLTAALRASLGV